MNRTGYDKNYYATNSKHGLLHRFLMKPPKGMVVDHINNNTLDNRIENLRVCTAQENAWNAKKQRNNKTGATGVFFHKQAGKWMAYITKDAKYHNLGYFNTFDEAKAARIKAEINLYGEFSFNAN